MDDARVKEVQTLATRRRMSKEGKGNDPLFSGQNPALFQLMPPETSDEAFQVIKDVPLGQNDADHFGYSDIAAQIKSIYLKSAPPLTIGLYGQWGSGKSSICYLLRDRLVADGEKVFYFDTWKYERDSFRRQFLIEFDKDVFNGSLDYQRKLNQSLTVPKTLSLKQSLKDSFERVVVKLFVPTAIVLILIVGLLWAANQWALNLGLDQILAGVAKNGISAILILGVFAVIYKFLSEAVDVSRVDGEIPRTDSAEGFEYYYSEAIKKLNGKILIIIDNLDRLDKDKAVALLSDIKTFLANEKTASGVGAIFLVPCDDQAINDQLKKVFGDEFDTEEFLRKFFSLSVRIPRLLDLELDTYITKNIKKTKVADFQGNSSLVFVISRAFRNNPREIIQFLNSLTAQYLLAKQRNIEYVLDKEKIPFLAKILIIRTKWPEIYKDLEIKILRTSDTIDGVLAWMMSNDPERDDFSHRDFFGFTETTSTISDSRAGIFFSLKETPEQKKVPEWESFITAAEDIDLEALKKIYEKIAKEDRLDEFRGLLEAYVRQNENKPDKLVNIFTAIHSLVESENIKIFDFFLARIFNLVRPESFIPVAGRIDFSKVFNNQFSSLQKSTRDIIAKKFIAFLNALASRPAEINKEVDLVLDSFAFAISENAWPVFKTFANDLAAAKNNILQQLKFDAVFPGPLGDEEKETLKKILDFMASDKPSSTVFYGLTLSQFFFLMQYSYLQPGHIDEILTAALSFLERTKPSEFTASMIANQLKSFSSQLVALYNSNGDWTRRALIVKNMLKVRFPSAPLLTEINNCLKDFIENITNTPENILEAISDESLFRHDSEIRGDLIRRTYQNPDLLIQLKFPVGELSDEEKCQIVNNLNGRAFPLFLDFVEYINYKFPDQFQGNVRFKDDVVRNTINRYTAVADEPTLKRWLAAVKSIGLPADAAEVFFNNLKITRDKSEDFKKIIKTFIGRNKTLLAESQTEELKKD